MIEPMYIVPVSNKSRRQFYEVAPIADKLNELIHAFNEYTKPVNANPNTKKDQIKTLVPLPVSNELKEELFLTHKLLMERAANSRIYRNDTAESNRLYRIAEELGGLL